jgi:hypothetical protein
MCDILLELDVKYLALVLLLILSIIYYVTDLQFYGIRSQNKRFKKTISGLEELRALDIEHQTKNKLD